MNKKRRVHPHNQKNTSRTVFTVAAIVVLIAVIALISGFKGKNEVCFEEKCFEVEIPPTLDEKRIGLSKYDSLEEGKGMLFVFDEEKIYPFWMKDMKFSIDIIWMNADKEVVYIWDNAVPCGEICPIIDPKESGMYVLEVNAGLAEKYDIGVGDSARFNLD